jgi:hypothetical protein
MHLNRLDLLLDNYVRQEAGLNISLKGVAKPHITCISKEYNCTQVETERQHSSKTTHDTIRRQHPIANVVLASNNMLAN